MATTAPRPVLWTASPSSGTLVFLAAAEAGVDLEPRRLSLQVGEHRRPEYLAVNPKAQVPALQLPDGRVVTELPAILVWLARANPAARLLPAEPFAEAKTLEWVAWCHWQMASAFALAMNPGRFTADPAGGAAVREAGARRVRDALAHLDRALGDSASGLGGEAPTIADLFAFLLAYVSAFFGFDTQACPAVLAHQARIASRPRVREAIEREQAAMMAAA